MKNTTSHDRPPNPREKAHDPLLIDQEVPIGDHEQVSNPNTGVGGYGHGADDNDSHKDSDEKMEGKRSIW